MLREIAENQAYNDNAPVREVLAKTVDALAAPQKTLADLLGVSVRQLQRWLVPDGPNRPLRQRPPLPPKLVSEVC